MLLLPGWHKRAFHEHDPRRMPFSLQGWKQRLATKLQGLWCYRGGWQGEPAKGLEVLMSLTSRAELAETACLRL